MNAEPVFITSAFFVAWKESFVTESGSIKDRIARAASDFQQQCTGVTPQSVTVVLADDTLVISLHGSLSPAERVLSQSAAGAAQVQEFHRQLFATSSSAFQQQIQRIVGTGILEAAAEVEPPSGAIVHAFPSGTLVQVFQLARSPSLESVASLAGSPHR
jgi:uncharacterized protein YbcI